MVIGVIEIMRLSVCKLANRRVCGGNVSNLLCDKSRNNKSVKLTNNDDGTLSILKNKKKG